MHVPAAAPLSPHGRTAGCCKLPLCDGDDDASCYSQGKAAIEQLCSISNVQQHETCQAGRWFVVYCPHSQLGSIGITLIAYPCHGIAQGPAALAAAVTQIWGTTTSSRSHIAHSDFTSHLNSIAKPFFNTALLQQCLKNFRCHSQYSQCSCCI